MGPREATQTPHPQRLDERTPLARAYVDVRAQTERLSAPLSAEDQTPQSMPDASPVKWHRAHTTWFFETFVLREHLPTYEPFDERYAYLFNSYYNGIGPQFPRPRRGLVTRPGVEEVGRYRAHVDAAMRELLAQPVDAEVASLVTLGLHHEQQHQELLLTDVKHLLFQSGLDPIYTPAPHQLGTGETRTASWHRFERGIVDIGHRDESFAFDNEGPAHQVLLEAYELSDRLVTVGEVIGFIEDAGYERPELWLDAGLAYRREHHLSMPLYWRREANGAYSSFTLHGRRPLHDAEPAVHLSYFEADAIARWLGARLPSEAEWEHAASAAAGEALGEPLSNLHPIRNARDDFYGVAWQWTRSDYAPYPGYRPAEGAVGEYNGKFMCGQYVLRGSSAVTARGHARLSYRNFFAPSARWQMTGLRLSRDV